MKKIALYLSVVFSLSGCIISGTPDCDDMSTKQLQNDLKGFIKQAIRADIELKRDSVKAAFKEAGYNYMTIFPPKNPTPEYERLKNAFYISMGSLDTLIQQKLDSITPLTNNIIVKETGKLISEDENISLTTFHCTCRGNYILREGSGTFEYRLTRHDFDPKTYLKVTYASRAN